MSNNDQSETPRFASGVRSVLCIPLYVEIVAALVGLFACCETVGIMPSAWHAEWPTGLYFSSLIIAVVGLVLPPGQNKSRIGTVAIFFFNVALVSFPASLPAVLFSRR